MESFESDEAVESYVPYLMEDFSVGDRVYQETKDHEFRMGRVTGTRNQSVMVAMDDGKKTGVRLSSFDRVGGRSWGKALDLTQVSVGDRLSYAKKDIKRVFATVVKFIPDEKIVLDIEMNGIDGGYHATQTYTSRNASLEWWLAKWELEG